MKRPLNTLSLLILLLVSCFSLQAQLTPDQLVKKIKWNVHMEPAEGLKVGESIKVYFDATIEDGFHIYSVKPTEMGPLPTEIIVEKISGAETVGESQEINGELHTVYDEMFMSDVYYYDGKVTFFREFKILKTQAELTGFIDFQVCSEEMCVPHSEPFSFVIEAAKK